MRKIIAIGAGLATLLASTFTFASDPYEAIIADQQNGRYQQALFKVDKLLLENVNDVQAMLIKGNVHRLMGNGAEASYIFKQIIKRFPKMPEAYNNLAVLYAGQGQTALAIETLQQAFATSESYSTAYQNLRALYSEMASTAYRDALNIEKPKADKNAFKLTSLTQVESAPVVVPNAGNDARQSNYDAATADLGAIAAQPTPTESQVASSNQVKNEATNQVDIQADISAAVDGWSKAWAGQNSNDYFSYYHPNFIPPKGMNRKAWQTYRAKRIVRPKFINIEIVGLTVQPRDNDQATAIFEQHYRSDTYADTVVKKLTLAKYQDKWLIVQEVTL